MKRIIIALVLVAALTSVLLPAAVFAAEDTVVCTVTAGVVSVTVENGSVAYGTLSLDSVKNTALYHATNNTDGMDPAQTQTITNTSNVAVDLNIKTSAATGGTGWTLGDTQDDTHFTHAYLITDSVYDGGSAIGAFTKWSTADTYVEDVVTNLGVSGVKYLYLEIGIPTASDVVEKSINVTVQAVEAGS